MKTYEDGLNEAWGLARKIGGIGNGGYTISELSDIFGTCSSGYIFDNFTVSEAMDAIENSKRIKVGDEVVVTGEKGVVVQVRGDLVVTVVESDGAVSRWDMEDLEKTGRHFPQIEGVLRKMQENKGE